MAFPFISNLLVDGTLILLPIIYYILEKKDFKKELGFFSNGLKIDLKNIIVLFFTLVIFSILISYFANFFALNDLDKVIENIEKIQKIAPLTIWYFLIARVISEEVFFRGFLVKKAGVLASSIIFGLAHFAYGSYVEVFGAIILGLILAKAFQDNKNIYPNIIAHFLYNFVFLSVAL